MKIRIKWLVLRPHSADLFNRFVERMQLELFTEESTYGFIIDTLRIDWIEARFVEKFVSVETSVDPFGNELEVPRTIYSEISFRLHRRKDYLEIHNPPRSINAFINLLGSFVSGGIAIYSADIPVAAWLDVLNAKARSVAVTGALITNVALSKSVNAEVLFTGDSDVIHQINAMTAKRKYTLTQAEVEIEIAKDSQFKAIIRTDSRVNLSNGDTDLVKFYRTCFEELLSQFRL